VPLFDDLVMANAVPDFQRVHPCHSGLASVCPGERAKAMSKPMTTFEAGSPGIVILKKTSGRMFLLGWSRKKTLSLRGAASGH